MRTVNQGDIIDAGMMSVRSEFETAKDTMRRCRRVLTANAALYNAQLRLRERLAEFHSIELEELDNFLS
jgi:hypothetical protein